MSFDQFMTETITLIKGDGTPIEGIKASVQKKKIFVEGAKPLIEKGDHIVCTKSNGATDTYEVIDPGFHEAFHSLPAHYQIDVRNLNSEETVRSAQKVVYNLSGANSRVNQSSVDNSVNAATTNIFSPHVSDLRNSVKSSKLDANTVKSALETVDAVEAQLATDKPSKHVVKTLLDSLSPIANVTSIAAAIIALLSS